MYRSSGISCSSAALRRFSSRCSWITCAKSDGVSTGMLSSCSDAILPLCGSLSRDEPDRRRHAILAGALGAVEGLVGGGDQVVEGAALGKGRDAEARGERDPLTVRGADLVRRDRLASALGEGRATLHVRPGQDEGELLAAPAAGGVDVPDGLAERPCERAENEVADRMAVAVVHVREGVEIGEAG